MNLRYSASAGRNGSGMSVTIRVNSLGVIRAGYRALSVAAASLMRRRTPATAARHLAASRNARASASSRPLRRASRRIASSSAQLVSSSSAVRRAANARAWSWFGRYIIRSACRGAGGGRPASTSAAAARVEAPGSPSDASAVGPRRSPRRRTFSFALSASSRSIVSASTNLTYRQITLRTSSRETYPSSPSSSPTSMSLKQKLANVPAGAASSGEPSAGVPRMPRPTTNSL